MIRSLQLLGAVLTLLCLGFLYSRIQVPQFDEHQRLKTELGRIPFLEVSLSSRVMEARTEFAGNYDPIVRTLQQLKETRSHVDQRLHQLYNPLRPELAQPLEHYSQLLAQKAELVERFKTENAARNNSASYFPTLATLVQSQLNSLDKSERRYLRVEGVISGTLRYLATGSEAQRTALLPLIADLKASLSQYDSAVRPDLTLLVAHAQTITDTRASTDRLVAEFIALPTQSAHQSLSQAYESHFQGEEQRAGTYRSGLFGFCLLLVGAVGFSVVRLQSSAAALRREQELLERRVDERTSELAAAKDEMEQVLAQLQETALQVKHNATTVALTGSQLNQAVTGASESAVAVTRTMSDVSQSLTRAATLSGSVASHCHEQERSTSEASEAITSLLDAVVQVKRGSDRQQAATRTVDHEMETAARAVQEMTGSAERFSDAAHRAGEVARTSGESVRLAIDSMRRIQIQMQAFSEKVEDLGSKSGEIGGVIATINQIAKQTNLLALNATIEAARAGEHGRGFAIVADEVRKLASQVTTATSEIATLITGVRRGVDETIEAMVVSSEEVVRGAAQGTEAENSLQQILQATDSVAREVDTVNAATRQMEVSVGNTRNAVSGALQSIIESEHSIQTMLSQSQRVSSAVERVRQSSSRAVEGAVQMDDAMQEISGRAQEVAHAIQDQTASIQQAGQSANELNEMANHLKSLSENLQGNFDNDTQEEKYLPILKLAA